jgi:hypothetical protein
MVAAGPPEALAWEGGMMRSHYAEASRGIITELRAALDAVPADEPRNYLRQSLQLLVPLVEQMHQRLQALDARLEALESGNHRGEMLAGHIRKPDGLAQSS